MADFALHIIGEDDVWMATLTVTARGQVTFRKKVMEHLGVKPGEKIELDLLPDGRGVHPGGATDGKDRGLLWSACGENQESRDDRGNE